MVRSLPKQRRIKRKQAIADISDTRMFAQSFFSDFRPFPTHSRKHQVTSTDPIVALCVNRVIPKTLLGFKCLLLIDWLLSFLSYNRETVQRIFPRTTKEIHQTNRKFKKKQNTLPTHFGIIFFLNASPACKSPERNFCIYVS